MSKHRVHGKRRHHPAPKATGGQPLGQVKVGTKQQALPTPRELKAGGARLTGDTGGMHVKGSVGQPSDDGVVEWTPQFRPTEPFPFELERMRVLPHAPLRLDLLSLGVGSLAELGRQELLAAIEEGLQRIYGPIRFSGQRRAVGESEELRVNPAIPGLAHAEAAFLPLSPLVALDSLNLTGQSESFAQAGRTARDLTTRKSRPIEYADGAYLAIVLVREDGTLVPLSQGSELWQENTKFLGAPDNSPETEALSLKMLPEQRRGLVGLVAFNVGKNYLRAENRGQPLSAIRLGQLTMGRHVSDVPSRTVLLDDRAARRFYQLAPVCEAAEKCFFGHKEARTFTFSATSRSHLSVFYWGKWVGNGEGGNVTFEVIRERDGVERRERAGGANGGVCVIDVAPGETVTVRGDTLTAVQVFERPELEELLRSPFGLDEERRGVLHGLQHQVHGAFRAEDVRAQVLRQLTGRLSTVHLAELYRQTPALMALGHLALERADAPAHGWLSPSDVMYELSTRPAVLTDLGGQPPPSDLRADFVAQLVGAREVDMLAELLGVPVGALDGTLTPDPPTALRILAALQAAGLDPVLSLHALSHPAAPAFLGEEARAELAVLREAVGDASKNVLVRTPGELLRRICPETVEDLVADGLVARQLDGHTFAVVARRSEVEFLLHVPGARRLGDELSPRRRRSELPDCLGALGSPEATVGAPAAGDPFVRWAVRADQLPDAQRVAVAEIPLHDLVVDVFAENGPRVVTGVLNPESVRWVLEDARGADAFAEPGAAGRKGGGRVVYDRQQATVETLRELGRRDQARIDVDVTFAALGLVRLDAAPLGVDDLSGPVVLGELGELRLVQPRPIPTPLGPEPTVVDATFARGDERLEVPLCVTSEGVVIALERPSPPPPRGPGFSSVGSELVRCMESPVGALPPSSDEESLARALLIDAVVGRSSPSMELVGASLCRRDELDTRGEVLDSDTPSLAVLRATPPYDRLVDDAVLQRALAALEQGGLREALSAALSAAGLGDEERWVATQALQSRLTALDTMFGAGSQRTVWS